MGTPLVHNDIFVFHGRMKTGDTMITHRHERAGQMLLADGVVVVDHFGAQAEYHAPAIIPIDADKHYEIKALTPVIVSCIHVLRDGETSPPIKE